jgi:hypothetical protein
VWGARLRARLTASACLEDPSERVLAAELEAMQRSQGRFDADRPFQARLPEEATGPRYRQWTSDFIEQDVHASQLGLLASPYKAALEVCRDLRESIRYAVDFDGLTDASHVAFYRHYAPAFNRLVGGPISERSRELAALLDAAVVRLAMAPAGLGANGSLFTTGVDGSDQSVSLDWVIAAHDQSNGVIRGASRVIENLHQAGLVTTVRSIPGLDGIRVDALSRPIDAEGHPVDNLAILGPLTEGSRFYNHYVVNASAPSRLLDDADRVARRMLGLPQLQRSTPVREGD